MRGQIDRQGALFHTFSPDDLVPAEHPLREIKARVDAELKRMHPAFKKAYSRLGRPSIPPEQLLKASLLQALYSIRSERQLCEQLRYNFLYRWFLDLSPSAAVWDHSTFTINRARFAEHGLVQKFFNGTVAQGLAEQARESEEFAVDGTLIEAFGSLKSVRPKGPDDENDSDGDDDSADGDDDHANGDETTRDPARAARDTNGWADFTGTKRSNTTHASITDPEARLARRGRGQSAKLCHSLHALTATDSGLVLDVSVAEANGRAEREETLAMLDRVRRRHWISPKALTADKGYDAGEFLVDIEARGIEPMIAVRDGRITARDAGGDARRRARRRQRTKRGRDAQRRRRAIEQVFGWIKGVAGLSRTRFKGRWKTTLSAYAAAAAYNLMLLSRRSPA